MRRTLDVLVSAAALLALSPLFLLVMSVLRVTGERKVWYRQPRVGHGGECFDVLKFNTMCSGSEHSGAQDITLRQDPRVLPVGRVLRKTKINELPQLVNVLKGEMTLVGWRPLMPVSFSYYPEHVQRRIVRLKPGLTGIGSVIFRDEEAIVEASQKDPGRVYREDIAPYKGAVELWYQDHQSGWVDIKIAAATVWSILFPESDTVFRWFPGLPEPPDGVARPAVLEPRFARNAGGGVASGNGERPRILLVSPTGEFTGPVRSLLLLIQELSRRYEVEVLISGAGPLQEALEADGVPHTVLGWPKSRRWPKQVLPILRLARWFRAQPYALVYANEVNATTRNVCLAARLASIPYACHVRSMGWRHGWKQLGYLKRATAVVAVSEACAGSVERFVRSGRLRVVHNGAPTPEVSSGRQDTRLQVRKELELQEDTPLLLGVGHLTPRKGQQWALDAMDILATRCPEAHLVLLGARDREPTYVEALEARARRRPLRGRVTIRGFDPDPQRFFAAADVFVHTAVLDPHPRAVLEAMAASLPVVSFATDGVDETVVHGETGTLVPKEDAAGLAEALARCLEEPEEAERMGRAGRHRIERSFSPRDTARKVDAIVHEALIRTGRHPKNEAPWPKLPHPELAQSSGRTPPLESPNASRSETHGHRGHMHIQPGRRLPPAGP